MQYRGFNPQIGKRTTVVQRSRANGGHVLRRFKGGEGVAVWGGGGAVWHVQGNVARVGKTSPQNVYWSCYGQVGSHGSQPHQTRGWRRRQAQDRCQCSPCLVLCLCRVRRVRTVAFNPAVHRQTAARQEECQAAPAGSTQGKQASRYEATVASPHPPSAMEGAAV